MQDQVVLQFGGTLEFEVEPGDRRKAQVEQKGLGFATNPQEGRQVLVNKKD